MNLSWCLQGTVSPLHKDPYHNCLAQVVGSKYIRIYHPRHQACLYPYADFTRKNSSQVARNTRLPRHLSTIPDARR